MVAAIVGVVKLFTPAAVPTCSAVPPVEAEYQSTVSPVLAVADMVTVPEPQFDAGETVVGAAGNALIVTRIFPDAALHPLEVVTVTARVTDPELPAV